ncbi:hypothetical protein [Pseudomonas corrugata]
MSAPPSSLRKALVAWLYAAALMHLLVSLMLTWAGHSGLLDGYLQTLEHAFWSDAAVPSAARAQQVWWLALFGATLQSYSLYMLALVHIGNRLRRAMPWGWLIAGIVLCAPQDMLVSTQAQVWSHLIRRAGEQSIENAIAVNEKSGTHKLNPQKRKNRPKPVFSPQLPENLISAYEVEQWALKQEISQT